MTNKLENWITKQKTIMDFLEDKKLEEQKNKKTGTINTTSSVVVEVSSIINTKDREYINILNRAVLDDTFLITNIVEWEDWKIKKISCISKINGEKIIISIESYKPEFITDHNDDTTWYYTINKLILSKNIKWWKKIDFLVKLVLSNHHKMKIRTTTTTTTTITRKIMN